ncbi:MAG: hypothetical protein K6V97_05370 [Actinomycetia bacterium]|nr:hypothetical protein [Actinomycetes bacterium]
MKLRFHLQDLGHRLPLQDYRLEVGAGVSFYPADSASYQDLYRVADRRLCEAKRRGQGRIVTDGGDDS